MKLRFAVATMIFASLLIFSSTNVAQAQWDAIYYGHAVTINPYGQDEMSNSPNAATWEGQDVPLGESVTATAGTTDSEVEKVEFRWLDPAGNVRWDVLIDVSGPYTTPDVPNDAPQEIIDWAHEHPGIDIWYARHTTTLNVIGDWAVQAIFHGTSNIRGRNSDICRIRAPLSNVVPEVPFGTIAVLLSMFGALGVYAVRRKHFPTGKSD